MPMRLDDGWNQIQVTDHIMIFEPPANKYSTYPKMKNKHPVPVQPGRLHKAGLWDKLCRDIEGETCLVLSIDMIPIPLLVASGLGNRANYLPLQMQTTLTSGADSCQLPDKKSLLFRQVVLPLLLLFLMISMDKEHML